MSAQASSHMSPAQAAQAANVSRWTIMRAVKSHKLKAIRDNRNNWLISPDDLARWAAAHCARDKPPAHVDEASSLRELLASERVRADAAERARDQAEAERDHWREMAQRLASRPRGLWFWRGSR